MAGPGTLALSGLACAILGTCVWFLAPELVAGEEPSTLYHDASGTLHINTTDNAPVLFNGVDVLERLQSVERSCRRRCDHDAISAPNSGRKTWLTLLGSTERDNGLDVVVDGRGGVFVVGDTSGDLDGHSNVGKTDVFLAKFNAATGEKLWTQQLGSAENDEGRGVALDSSGDHVYVCGEAGGNLGGSTSAVGGRDYFLSKFDSGNGSLLWTVVDGTAELDVAYGLAVDGADNVFVTGETQGSLHGHANEGNSDLFFSKYSSNGTRLFTQILATAEHEVGYALSLAPDGNVGFVTGYTRGSLDGFTVAGERDILVARFATDTGNVLSVQQLGTSFRDTANGVVVAGDVVYVTGETYGDLGGISNAGSGDLFVAEFGQDLSKTANWIQLLGSGARDRGFDVAVRQNQVHVAGHTNEGLGGGILISTFAATDGARQWLQILGAPGLDAYSYARGIALDSNGTIFIAGYTGLSIDGIQYAGGLSDVVVARLD